MKLLLGGRVRVGGYGRWTGTGAFWENADWAGRFLRDGL
jgi:hypothetical protein